MGTELREGTTLQNGKYTIVKSLGQGSFGITYLATTKLTMMGKLGQMDTTVNVAIKEFFMSEMNSRSKDGSSIEGSNGSLFSNYRQKFKKEAENLSKLDHPNIVNVLDVFDENNTTYYVMQYIDGQSLDDYISQQNGIKESKAISILKEIGKAVQYMHSNRMLHLDLKPKNVMLDKDEKIFLIDFGLSKQYDSKGEPESSTKVGAGTPGYAPIEQANYREGKGFPVTMDVYALGATMFKMLTGKRAPEASDILNDGFPLYELQEHKISDRLSASVAKAMAPAKKDRYQTVEEFLNSFEEEATIIGVEVAEGKREGKEKNVDSRLFEISPLTKKVEISFLPSFPSAGMYEATIKKDEIQIRSGLKKSRWYLSRKAFSKFLTSLTALNLTIRGKENPEYLEASEDAAKLTITLYDENNSKYAKYWIGGWGNQFGNIIGKTLAINEQLEKIIPHFNDFLNSPIEDEEEKIEKASPKEKIKKILQIRSDTSKVRIEYWPYSLFPPRYTGAFITTVTPYEVNPNVTQESTREMIPMTQGKYKNFINALQALKLEIREETVEHFNPGSFSPAKLKITLYDNAGVIYNNLWIDGMSGGNIVGNVDVIEKQIIQIVPGLSQYLNGPFYEVPNLIKEKETQRKTTRSEITKPIREEKDGISYRWWSVFVLILEISFALFMLTQSRESDLDSDGRLLSGLYFFAALLCVYYLFNARNKINSQKWRLITIVSTIACFANSCLLPIWNGSLTGAYFLLSLGLSIISSFTLLIKKSV